MAELAARFRDEKSRPLINITHSERGPWDKIWDSGRGNNERIPYSLAVPDDDPNRDAILEAAREYEAIASASQHRSVRVKCSEIWILARRTDALTRPAG